MTINRKRKQRGKSEAKQLHELSDTESANSGTIIDTPLINSYTCSCEILESFHMHVLMKISSYFLCMHSLKISAYVVVKKTGVQLIDILFQ